MKDVFFNQEVLFYLFCNYIKHILPVSLFQLRFYPEDLFILYREILLILSLLFQSNLFGYRLHCMWVWIKRTHPRRTVWCILTSKHCHRENTEYLHQRQRSPVCLSGRSLPHSHASRCCQHGLVLSVLRLHANGVEQHDLFSLYYFSQPNVSQIHPCISSTFWVYWTSTFHLGMYLCVDGRFSNFYTLSRLYAIKFMSLYMCKHKFSFLSCKYVGMESLSYTLGVCLTL